MSSDNGSKTSRVVSAHRLSTPLFLVIGVLVASCGGRSDPNGSSAPAACDAVPVEVVEAIIGPADAVAYDIDQLSECRWSAAAANEAEIILRIETPADPTLFVEHSIEATPPDRVELVNVGEQGVVFAGEAALTRQGEHIVMVTSEETATSEPVETSELVPVLAAAVEYLDDR